MKDHTTAAMLDVLFELRDMKDACYKINESIFKLNTNSDFNTHISSTVGKIESKLVDALDLYLEEVTGCEVLATHMLYETGIVYDENKTKYNLASRKKFEEFIEHQRGRK